MPLDPLLPLSLIAIWLIGWILVSVQFRVSRGKPIFPAIPDNALYAERWGSGRNVSAFWRSIGRASSGCLVVTVTADRVTVTPRFPFNLMFLPEVCGLEFDVPLRDIAKVEQKRFLWRDVALITFMDGRRLELYPRRIDDFMAALRRPGS